MKLLNELNPIILLCFSIILFGCQKDQNSNGTNNNNEVGSIKLVAPASGTQLEFCSVTLQWELVGTGSKYKILVSANSGFTEIVVDIEWYGSEKTVFLPASNKRYYWKVREVPDPPYTYAGWSTIWNFTTGTCL